MTKPAYDFGMIGLGTMGRNLLLNMADHHFAVIGFDINRQKAEEFEASANEGTVVKGVYELPSLVSQLKRPRKIMMLVPAGKPVDDVIQNLLPQLDEDDIVIDGGNSHYTDTLKRIRFLLEKKIHFMGIGISGGEMGARTGPSIMPGGDEFAWQQVKPILDTVAAKVNNEPCVSYMGKWAAGHYVKMVHNGIEYAIMQLISEAYSIMKHGLELSNREISGIFKKWNQGESKSFLIEITADILRIQDESSEEFLVDLILDKAAAKGTGKWTSQDAMDLGIPIPSIDVAVSMRSISALHDQRQQAAGLYETQINAAQLQKNISIGQLHDALYTATILCYSQGLALLQTASVELDMNIPVAEVTRIWRGGCIIRSALLEVFYAAFKENPSLENLLLDKKIALLVNQNEKHLRAVVQQLAATGIVGAGFMSSLTYFDAYRSKRLPTNLIQAQRDYFGAHGYQRIDREGTFHTEWQELPEHHAEKPEHKP